MSKPKTPEAEELKTLLEERSKEVLLKFRQTAVLGIKNPELITVLETVTKYWTDAFRPALASFCCEAVGGKPNETEDVSLMITLMAAGLGIHDDIIDKSTSKHFRMTLLGLYDSDISLLAGELLIVKSLASIRKIIEKNLPAKKIIDIINLFENFFVEVWEGEYLETRCRRNLDTSLEEYKRILWMSTADVEACARLGAILGNGSSIEVNILAEFGRRLGFMSQLLNEVTDTLNTDGALFNKLDRESVPLPILYTSKNSENYQKIKLIFDKQFFSAKDVETILKLCFECNAFVYISNLAEKNKIEALEKLCQLKPSFARDILQLMFEVFFNELSRLIM